MKNDDRDARQWRERARQLRLLAKQMTHPKARNDLAEVVERWEQAARGAEVKPRLMRRAEGKRQPQGGLR